MIRMTVIAKVRPEKKEEFLDAMRSLQQDRLKEQGILRSKLFGDRGILPGFRLIDEWETDEDLQRYLSKEGFRVLLGALRTLCTKAEVKYNPLWRK